MRNLVALLVVAGAFILFSCNKKCDCQNNWDPNVTYYSGDLVSHNGVCWKAFGQGGGSIVEPGTPGGDIWEKCTD